MFIPNFGSFCTYVFVCCSLGSFASFVFIFVYESFSEFDFLFSYRFISDLRGLLKPLLLLMVLGLFLSLNHLFVIVLIKFHGSISPCGVNVTAWFFLLRCYLIVSTNHFRFSISWIVWSIHWHRCWLEYMALFRKSWLIGLSESFHPIGISIIQWFFYMW